jgi:hypothetical protein
MEFSSQLHDQASLRPWKQLPGTNFVEGKVGPGTGKDVLKWKKISCTCRESNTNHRSPD